MKDLYSFTKTTEELDTFYDACIEAYKKIFSRVGLGEITYLTVASGGSFGTKYSHEFQTLTGAGEDLIYIDKNKNIAINKEVLNEETLSSLGLKREDLVEEKSVEVGNIYKLGSFYSEPLELTFKTESGETKPVIMGSYGIGVSRLMGVITEVFADDKGLVWPKSVSPYHVHLIALPDKEGKVLNAANILYNDLMKKGIEVLFDDRDARPGEKFADSDLIGIPTRVVMSEKTMAENVLEVKDRKSGEVKKISVEEFISSLK
jgi:prolyl-tRNA synthetase